MYSYIVHPNDEYYKDFVEMPGFDISDHSINKEIAQQYLLNCVLVKSGNSIVARAAIYKNPYHKIDGKECLSIGYFESINDLKVVELLFQRIIQVAQLYKCDSLIGPINGSTWRSYRFQTAGDSRPFFMEYQVPDYYYKLWKHVGFYSMAKYKSDKIDLYQSIKEVDSESYCRKRGLTIRNLTNSNLKDEIRKIGQLSLECFGDNYLYSPISLLEFEKLYSKAISFIDPSMVLVAMKDEELVGFIFAVPNYLDNFEKGIIIKTIARKSGRNFIGLGSVLSSEIIKTAKTNSYDYIVNAYYHEANQSSNTSRNYGGEDYKSYELLQYKIESPKY